MIMRSQLELGGRSEARNALNVMAELYSEEGRTANTKTLELWIQYPLSAPYLR
jgi:hypothetical protein